jgi:hypothetical protein
MKLCFETSRLLDASGRIQRQKLVPFSGDYSNQLFKELEDWNRILTGTSLAPPAP